MHCIGDQCTREMFKLSCLFSQNLDNTTTTFRYVVYFQFHSASGINWTIHPDLFGFSLKKYRWNLFTVGVTVSLYTVYVIKLQWVDFSICTWSQLQSKISAWDGTADMPIANLPTVKTPRQWKSDESSCCHVIMVALCNIGQTIIFSSCFFFFFLLA